MKIDDYFCIEELVDQEVFNRFGQYAWRFIDDKLIENLLFVRQELDKPITINNWKWGGQFTQRGLRHNKSPLVINKKRPYLSAHMFGKAVDFDVKGMTAQEVRTWIITNSERLPHPTRLENNVSWVHMDVINSGKKVFLFAP